MKLPNTSGLTLAVTHGRLKHHMQLMANRLTQRQNVPYLDKCLRICFLMIPAIFSSVRVWLSPLKLTNTSLKAPQFCTQCQLCAFRQLLLSVHGAERAAGLTVPIVLNRHGTLLQTCARPRTRMFFFLYVYSIFVKYIRHKVFPILTGQVKKSKSDSTSLDLQINL